MTCVAVPVAILLWKALIQLVNWCRGNKNKEEKKDDINKETRQELKVEKDHIPNEQLRQRQLSANEVT